MAKQEWSIWISETIRHEVKVKIDSSCCAYPYVKPREIAINKFKKLKQKRPRSTFVLEALTLEKPEVHCYFDI